MKMSEHYTKRRISHGEAQEIAQRLINSHFRQEPHARVGIPARPDYDDDLLILAYIHQQRERDEVWGQPTSSLVENQDKARLYDAQNE